MKTNSWRFFHSQHLYNHSQQICHIVFLVVVLSNHQSYRLRSNRWSERSGDAKEERSNHRKDDDKGIYGSSTSCNSSSDDVSINYLCILFISAPCLLRNHASLLRSLGCTSYSASIATLWSNDSYRNRYLYHIYCSRYM